MKYVVVIFVLLVMVVASAGCTSPDRARQALENEGYTEIELTGYSVFKCSDEDQFKNGFTAKNEKGDTVSGAVCCGFLKGCTIRY